MSVCQIKLCRLATDFGCLVVIFQDGGPYSALIASLVLPANPLNSADPFGFGMRPLAGFLLCWDRKPLKHSCLWAAVRKCKTKSPFVLPGQWMCTHGVERQPVAQREGFDWLCSSTQGSWKRHHLHFISQSCVRKHKNGGSSHCGRCSMCTP